MSKPPSRIINGLLRFHFNRSRNPIQPTQFHHSRGFGSTLTNPNGFPISGTKFTANGFSVSKLISSTSFDRFSMRKYLSTGSKLGNASSKRLGFQKLEFNPLGIRGFSIKSPGFGSKLDGALASKVIQKPVSAVSSTISRYREAVSLQLEGVLKRNYMFLVGFGGVLVCIFLWKIMFGTANTFVGLSAGMAKYGFLALSSAMVAFAGLYMRSRYTIKPDAVYRMATRKLNTSASILEVMGTPLVGTDLRAYVMSGGGVTLSKFKPRLRSKRCFLIFPVQGSERKGLVNVEVKKKKGQVLCVATMAHVAPKFSRALRNCYHSLLYISSSHFIASHQSVEESMKTAVSNKSYHLIPNLLTIFKGSYDNPNPFAFLSAFPLHYRNQVIDEILQSFIHLKPRSQAGTAYDCLLSFTLQSSNPFPIAFAVLQRALRCGCAPVPQIHLLLSSAWLETQFQETHTASAILLQMKSIGYHLDCGTCNYLISSLCDVDELEAAVEVLRGMIEASCMPDVESYSPIIATMSMLRQTTRATTLLKEMTVKHRLSPKQGLLVKLFASLRANKEIWEAVHVIESLQSEAFDVGFESYELVVEGCLECREFVLAAKLVTQMTDKGFIPYIKVRQKVVDGLISVGEWRLACSVRHRFAVLNS